MPRSRTVYTVLKNITESSKGITPSFINRIDQKVEVAVIDEAHRSTEIPDKLVHVKVLVILQDDNQRVLGNEIGTYKNFKNFAKKHGMEYHHALLRIQKRSSAYYVNHIDHLLYGEKIDRNFKPDNFNVTVCENLKDFNDAIEDRHRETQSVKYYAPYCWEWKSYGGRKVIDISISDGTYAFNKMWNPINQQYEWYKDSIDRVGCVYTAQGLGFDYVGLIWWDDLKWDKQFQKWKVDINKVIRYDTTTLRPTLKAGPNYDYLIKNIYRVLLTRAKKGIYIWFKDKDTEEHFKKIVIDSK